MIFDFIKMETSGIYDIANNLFKILPLYPNSIFVHSAEFQSMYVLANFLVSINYIKI